MSLGAPRPTLDPAAALATCTGSGPLFIPESISVSPGLDPKLTVLSSSLVMSGGCPLALLIASALIVGVGGINLI